MGRQRRLPGFNGYLQEIARQFSHVEVHPDVWLATRPASSDSPHLFIKAIRELEVGGEIDITATDHGRSTAMEFAWRLRCAFFRECRDVSTRQVQHELAERMGIPPALVESRIDSGVAFAALATDYQERDRLKIEGSPTFVLNQGRQKLYGNVGYRVIEANIREVLRAPGAAEISWC